MKKLALIAVLLLAAVNTVTFLVTVALGSPIVVCAFANLLLPFVFAAVSGMTESAKNAEAAPAAVDLASAA